VQANTANAEASYARATAGWKAQPATMPFKIALSGEAREMTFQVTPPAGEAAATMRAVAKVGGRDIASGMQVIAYPHIRRRHCSPPLRSSWCGRTSR